MKKFLSIIMTLALSTFLSVTILANDPNNPDATWAISITADDFSDESEGAIWLEGGGNFHYSWDHTVPEMNSFKAGDTLQVLIDGYVQSEVDSVSVTLGRMSIGPDIDGTSPTWGWAGEIYQYYGKDAEAFESTLIASDFTDGQLVLKLPIPGDIKPATAYYSRNATAQDSLFHWMLQLTGTSTTHDNYMNFVIDFEAGTASLSSIVSNDLNVYPNPTNAGRTITIDASKFMNEVSVNVYKLNGQLVSSQTVNASKNVRLKASYPPGLYTLEVNDGNKSSIKKLIVK